MKLFLLFLLFIISISARNFGYNKDVRFANLLWIKMNEMKLVGERSISTRPYRGLPPHGSYVEMVESKITVGRTYGFVVILKNYMSPNINIINIINNPSMYLKSISVMFKRKDGYDSDNKNWFYVQYSANGAIMKSTKGFRLAGKISKSTTRGCISCHSSAPSGDYIFSHDKLAHLKESKMYKIRDNKKKKKKMSAMRKKIEKNRMQEHKQKMLMEESKTIDENNKMKMDAMHKMSFGTSKDIMYAKQLWDNMQKATLNSKPSNLYIGSGPHGKVREVLQGNINGKKVIVKRNYDGKGVNINNVSKKRVKYLQSITVMAKRADGYDSQNANWFWAKYKPDGSLHKNKKDMMLAGKISKGCISCHNSAPGNTLLFPHNKMLNAEIVSVKDFVSKKMNKMNKMAK